MLIEVLAAVVAAVVRSGVECLVVVVGLVVVAWLILPAGWLMPVVGCPPFLHGDRFVEILDRW